MSPMQHQQAVEAARTYLLTALGPQVGDQLFRAGLNLGTQQLDFYRRAIQDIEAKRKGAQPSHVKALTKYRHEPVDVRTFVEDKYFMDSKGVLYPKVLDALCEINCGDYQEAVLTGAIGTGKSTLALYTNAYQLYRLSCMRDPHGDFGLDPSSEIVFIFQSINAKLAKAVDYDRFKTMVTKSPYFMEEFPYDKNLVSELKFPRRIIVKPITGSETGAIGQNVIAGLIDEMNFMAMVENSKQSSDAGVYDQATALYDSIALRRKSRFMKKGELPGVLCLVSSKRYPGQFTDRKEAEARLELERNGKTSIYIYDKREWEVKPADRFSGKWFNVFIGDDKRRPRILREDEKIDPDERPLVMPIPMEYLVNFEADIMKALRDIGGVSTLATHPFILDRNCVSKCTRTSHIMFSREKVDFQETKLSISRAQFYRPELPRFVHVDLAIRGDSAGFAVGTVDKFSMSPEGGLMPRIWIDGLLEIKAPKNGEIYFYKIREVIRALKEMGMNIQWVSFDQFQSTDSIQLLRQQGFSVGIQSVDTTLAPYEALKAALYEDRIVLPPHQKCELELASLEKDVKKGKVDHPPHGSKDVADALAGVAFGLMMRREIWSYHKIPTGSIPLHVLNMLKSKDKSKEQVQTATKDDSQVAYAA